jgi:hypothetical protein
MRVDSLDELKVAFARWRRAKRHVRETVPDDLLLRARRAAKEHGVKEVVRAIRVERSRLFGRRQEEGGTAAPAPTRRPQLPAFSRLALSPPAVGVQPVAEVETAAGLKLRVFVESHAMVGLLSSLCGRGGVS